MCTQSLSPSNVVQLLVGYRMPSLTSFQSADLIGSIALPPVGLHLVSLIGGFPGEYSNKQVCDDLR